MGPLCNFLSVPGIVCWHLVHWILLVNFSELGRAPSFLSSSKSELSPRGESDPLDLSPNSFNWKQFFLFLLEGYVAIWEVNISRSACTPERCIHFYSLVSLVFGTLWDVFCVSLALVNKVEAIPYTSFSTGASIGWCPALASSADVIEWGYFSACWCSTLTCWVCLLIFYALQVPVSKERDGCNA